MSGIRIIDNVTTHLPSTREGCERKALEIVAGMEPWWRDVNKPKKTDQRDGRTEREQNWDSGVNAASEFVRRFLGYDERVAIVLNELTFWARKQREKEKAQ